MRGSVGQGLQDERLGVPERVSVVTRTGQSLGGYRPPLRASTRLQGMEECEADRLLELGVSLKLHVGAIPEVLEVVTLGAYESLPAASACCGEGRLDLVAHRRHGALARPAVPQELHQPKALPRLELRGNRNPSEVLGTLSARLCAWRPFDNMVHTRGHPQSALLRGVHEHDPGVVVGEVL